MLWNTLLLALRAIRRNLLRSFLTMLGIVIGVGAVITMVTLGNGATQVGVGPDRQPRQQPADGASRASASGPARDRPARPASRSPMSRPSRSQIGRPQAVAPIVEHAA